MAFWEKANAYCHEAKSKAGRAESSCPACDERVGRACVSPVTPDFVVLPWRSTRLNDHAEVWQQMSLGRDERDALDRCSSSIFSFAFFDASLGFVVTPANERSTCCSEMVHVTSLKLHSPDRIKNLSRFRPRIR
jgi:hypothetical protein